MKSNGKLHSTANIRDLDDTAIGLRDDFRPRVIDERSRESSASFEIGSHLKQIDAISDIDSHPFDTLSKDVPHSTSFNLGLEGKKRIRPRYTLQY